MSFFNIGIPNLDLDSMVFGKQKLTKRTGVYIVSFLKDGILDQRVIKSKSLALNYARSKRQDGYEVEIERG